MSQPDKTCPECGTHYHGAAVFCQKEGAALVAYVEPSDPLVGTTLLDQFRIDAVIGRGGMGQVYRARQTTLGRDVAIKVLHRDLVKNHDATRRFQQEARVATSIAHEHLVQVYLFGQLPDGSLYLVMELLEGRSLADVLRDDGQLPLQRALRISYDTAMAVGAAHAKGIIHRDIKPENVMMVTRGGDPDFAKVLDFGIAKVLHDAAGEKANRLTQSGVIFGTARYISPEAAAGESADARSDVYSMAILTYQLLCHEPPFDAKTPVALLMKHLHDKPPHLRKRPGGAHVPPAVADVVMRALNKNPEARHDNATEFARALERAAASAGVHFVGGTNPNEAQTDPRHNKTLVEAANSAPASGPSRPRPGMATKVQGSPIMPGAEAAEQVVPSGPVAPPTEGGYLSNPGAQAPAPYRPRPIAARVAMPAMPMPMPSAGHPPAAQGHAGTPGFSTQDAMAAAPSPYSGSGDTAMMQVPGLGGPRRGRFGMFAAIALAAALMIGAGGFFMHLRTEAAEEAQLEGLEARAREALSHGAIDTPPGENVTALTNRILERDPHHAGARALRREAALLLREQAANARSHGNLDEARAAYTRVLALFPDDPAAERGLEALGTATGAAPAGRGGSGGLGGGGAGLRPGVHLEPETPTARRPARLVGVFGPELRLPDDVLPEFTIFRGGRRVHRTAARRGGVSGTWVADYTFTRTGAYEVTLEFGVGAQRVMLREEVTVAGAPRAPRSGRRPAVVRPRERGERASDNTPLPPPPGGGTGFRPLGPPMQATPITPTATPGGMRASDGEVDWSAMPAEPPPPWTGQ